MGFNSGFKGLKSKIFFAISNASDEHKTSVVFGKLKSVRCEIIMGSSKLRSNLEFGGGTEKNN